jgi:hypothetical protein
MKSEKLEVEANLSGYWLYKAMDRISLLSEVPEININYTIMVSEEDLPISIPFAYLFDAKIEVNLDYEMGEWSLTGWHYEDASNAKSFTIWSPGA